MRKLLLIAALSLLPLLSQAKVKGYYRVSLESVEVNDSVGTIQNVLGADQFTYPTYADDKIDIRFEFQPTHIDFLLTNKADSNLKIHWDDAIYVGGPNGISTGVFHAGVKLIDRELPQTPSVVVKGSKINDLLVTKSGVSFNAYFGRWMYNYILYWEDQLTNVKILLPIEINGVKFEYLFSFSVDWENVKVKTRIIDGKEYYFQMK